MKTAHSRRIGTAVIAVFAVAGAAAFWLGSQPETKEESQHQPPKARVTPPQKVNRQPTDIDERDQTYQRIREISEKIRGGKPLSGEERWLWIRNLGGDLQTAITIFENAPDDEKPQLLKAFSNAYLNSPESQRQAVFELFKRYLNSDTATDLMSLGLRYVETDLGFEMLTTGLAMKGVGRVREQFIQSAIINNPSGLDKLVSHLQMHGYPEDLRAIQSFIVHANDEQFDKLAPALLQNLGAEADESLVSALTNRFGHRLALQGGHIGDHKEIFESAPKEVRNRLYDAYWRETFKRQEGYEQYPMDTLLALGLEPSQLRIPSKIWGDADYHTMGPKAAVQNAARLTGEVKTSYLQGIAETWLGDDTLQYSRFVASMPHGQEQKILGNVLLDHLKQSGSEQEFQSWQEFLNGLE